MPILGPLLLGVVTPALVYWVVQIGCARPFGPRTRAKLEWSQGVAHAMGYACAFVVLFGFPSPSPREDWQWLFHVVFVLLAAGIAETIVHPRRKIKWALRVAVCAVVTWMLLPSWAEQPVFQSTVMFATALAVWSCVSVAYRRATGRGTSAVLFVACVAASGVLLLSGNARFAQLAGVLAATVAAQWTATFWTATVWHDGGSAAVVTGLSTGLLFVGYLNNYSDVSAGNFFLAALLPCIATVGLFRSKSESRRWLTVIVMGCAVAAAICVVGWALWSSGYLAESEQASF